MTNSYNDIRNAKTMIIMGGNPAEAHPVSLQHVLEGKETAARQHDRDRSAHDAHGGARDRIRPHPLRHRHPGDLGHAVARLQERLGGQAVHRAARLRHGRHPQGSREIHARRGRAHLRRAGRAARARRQDVRDREARDPDLVHGRDPAHRRHRQRARVLHRAAGHRQRRRSPAPAPTSSAATPTCRARPTSASIS